MIAPMPLQDVQAGREALAKDLARFLRDKSLIEVGWSQPDDLTLLVPMFAENSNGQRDLYLLKLIFDHYPKGPPSAQFVNPLTSEYKFPEDVMWVPMVEGSSLIAFHPNYNGSCQLICSSTTLEFYKVNHDVEEKNVWIEGRMSFRATISAIRSVLMPPFYKGRSVNNG